MVFKGIALFCKMTYVAIAWLSGQSLKITGFQHFLCGLQDTELKTGNFQSLNRKPSYRSFFSVLCPDLKNVFFEKNQWAPFEILEVKRLFSRSQRPNLWISSIFSGFSPSLRTLYIHSDRISWFWFHSTTLTAPGPPRVSREAKLFTEFEFGSLVR